MTIQSKPWLSIASFNRNNATIVTYDNQNNTNNNVDKDNIINHISDNIITIVLPDIR